MKTVTAQVCAFVSDQKRNRKNDWGLGSSCSDGSKTPLAADNTVSTVGIVSAADYWLLRIALVISQEL
jgi:hypothetical protein